MDRIHAGETPDGQGVDAYTLKNRSGMELRFLTYGGIVTHLTAPDLSGTYEDITLGFNSLDEYLKGHPYFGAIVGRVAGRLTHGRFTIDGNEYQLAVNQGPNHLHGGLHALDKKVWSAEPLNDQSVRLTYRSPDGEEGYPGNVDLSVTYTLTDDNEWTLEYNAVTDKTTPLSLTNHAYFNLAGETASDILDHEIQIQASRLVPTDDDFTLLDRIEPAGVQNFEEPRILKDVLDDLFGRHGANYVLNNPGEIRPVARVRHPASGRIMEVETDTTMLQFYTSVMLKGNLVGKSGRTYEPFSALCLECQGYPAGVNNSPVESILLHPGETYQQTTIYRFLVD